MRERTTHFREGGARAVNCTHTAEPVPIGAAIQIWQPTDILSVQVVRGVGLPNAVPSRDGLVEGYDRHLGGGRRESRGQARLHLTQSPRILRIRGDTIWSPEDEVGHLVRYVDTFLKSKAEDNGYPGWVQILEDEDI